MSSDGHPTTPHGDIPVDALLFDRIAVLEKQRDTLEMLLRALNTAPVLIWALEQDGTIALSEGKALEMFGLQPGSSVGANSLEMWAGTPAEPAIRAALDGTAHHLVTEPMPDVFFENWFIPIRRPDGEQNGVLGLSIVATERVRSERELREKLKLIERQSETIRALATPIIRVWDEVLVLPVIGTLDSQRTASMMDSLLESIVREKARFTIVDLTGVEIVDTATAEHIIRLFKAARVLGAEGVLCGIQPMVAQTVISLGVDLAGVRTVRTLQDALHLCIDARAKQRAERQESKAVQLS
jgi:rsbT co-antagonist protein RsbR